jgi:hypothetical protein
VVHAPPHLLFDYPQLRPHAVPPGLPGKQEFPRTGFAADEGGAQEVEGPRLALPSRFRPADKNSKANRIETGERSGGIGEICSVEVDEK